MGVKEKGESGERLQKKNPAIIWTAQNRKIPLTLPDRQCS